MAGGGKIYRCAERIFLPKIKLSQTVVILSSYRDHHLTLKFFLMKPAKYVDTIAISDVLLANYTAISSAVYNHTISIVT